MEIELHPTVSLLPETFSVLVAPVEMLAGALNSHLNLQRYKILYICGNYSRILCRLDRNFTELEIRRAFTVFQLMTILLYASALDPHLQKMTELADRVFCIYSEQTPAKGRKAEAEMPGAQATLEACS